MPPAPTVRVYGEGGSGETVRLEFQFPPHGSGEPEPWLLLTTVQSGNPQVPPLTFRTPLGGRSHGTVVWPLGEGMPPFELLVATLARNGLRSPFVRVRLPR